MIQSEFGQPYNVSSTTNIHTRPGLLLGFYVNSTSSGTIVIHDSTGGANAISGTITPAVGYHPFPAALGNGLRVVIANTLNITLFFIPS